MAPKKLPLDFLNQLFPNRVPEASFEFPDLTICPSQVNANLTSTGCEIIRTVVKSPCNVTERVTTVGFGTNGRSMKCLVISGGKVSSVEESLTMGLTISNVSIENSEIAQLELTCYRFLSMHQTAY